MLNAKDFRIIPGGPAAGRQPAGPAACATLEETKGFYRTMKAALLASALVIAAAVPARALLVSLDPGAPISETTGQIYLNASYIRASGARYARVNFILGPWSSPTDTTRRGPQSLTWKETYDQIINNLVAQGIEVYALIGAQAVRSSSSLNSSQYVSDYAANFTTIVGQFKDRVRVYESFNEPNDWAGGTTAQVTPYYFARMLKSIYQSVKIDNGHLNDPSWQVTLVSGPLFSHDQDTVASYFSQVYQEGISKLGWNAFKTSYGTYPLDGIGYHIYVALGSNTEQAVINAENKNLNAIWATITSYEGMDTPKRLWISEWGWNTAYISEAEQARNLTLVFNLYKNDSRIAFANWFQISDFGANDKWGLYRGAITDANKKPSWQAFYDFATAQQPLGTITGTVTDANAQPVQGVVISSTPGGYSAASNASGVYSMSVPPATYTLNSSRFGYRKATRTATVTAGETTVANFAIQAAYLSPSPADAKTWFDTAFLRLDGLRVTAAFDDRIYVQLPDGSSGIAAVGATASLGDTVDVAGLMATLDGERVLSAAQALVTSTGQAAPEPRTMSGRTMGGGASGRQAAVTDDAYASPAISAIGLGNVGLLARVAGRIVSPDTAAHVFYMDDGSGLRDGSGKQGVRVYAPGLALPQAGEFYAVTGIAGATILGGNVVRLLRPRGNSDMQKLYPELVQPQVANAGFESGVLSPWLAYGSTDGVISGSWFGDISAHSGTRFAGTATDGGTRSGGYYQQVACQYGATFRAQVFSRVYHGGNSANSTLSRVGIDPSGGTNPAAGSVVWSLWDSQAAQYTSVWRLIETPAVTVPGAVATIFLDFLQTEGVSWHINCFDDATIVAL